MKTIEMEMIVEPDGKSIMKVPVPPGLSPGKHRVILIIEEDVIPKKSEKVSADRKPQLTPSGLKKQFNRLRSAELDHLEEEFKDCKKRFPHK